MSSPWLPITDQLLQEWRAEPQVFESWEKGIDDLALSSQWPPGQAPKLAPFLSIGEGILFRELIRQALVRRPVRVGSVIDFGCGSSLPTLSAILSLSQADRPDHVWGLDIDAQALEASQHNVAAVGLESVYRFKQGDMLETLALHPNGLPAGLVVSNPPYVPTSPGASPGFLTPVDGGEDGLRFLRPLLESPLKPGTWLAVVASSLSSPAVLRELVAPYKVIHCGAHIVPFGPYLKSEAIHAHVIALRQQGIADCFTLPDGREAFITFTLLLEKE